MRGGHLMSQALVRQVAQSRLASQTLSPASTSTASWSIAGSSSSPSSLASTSCSIGALSSIRHRALLSTSARHSRPATTRVTKAELASLGQVPSMDLERVAFDMMQQASHKKSARPTKSKVPLTRKERRLREKEGRKKQKVLAKSQSMFGKAGLERTQSSPFVREDGQFRTFKPLTPGLRWVRQTVQPHLYKGPPVKSLTLPKRGHGGRNHHGKITVRGRGGGNRLRLRIVDFARLQTGLQTVLHIERDPNRSAHIARIQHNEHKTLSYIIAPEGVREGDTVESYRRSAIATGQFEGSALDLGIFRTKAIRPGNVLPLRLIPIGTEIHAMSLLPHGAAKLVRSAGSYGQIVAFVNRNKTMKPQAVGPEGVSSDATANTAIPGSVPDTFAEAEAEGAESADADAAGKGGMPQTTHVQVRLQSGEVRLLPIDCCAAIGRVSNGDHEHVRLGKAGRNRWRGRRPKVRGVAMNAVDHPHGGGRGKSKSNKLTRSIYGWKTKGPRTRKPGTRNGNQMVVRERPRMNGKRATKA